MRNSCRGISSAGAEARGRRRDPGAPWPASEPGWLKICGARPAGALEEDLVAVLEDHRRRLVEDRRPWWWITSHESSAGGSSALVDDHLTRVLCWRRHCLCLRRGDCWRITGSWSLVLAAGPRGAGAGGGRLRRWPAAGASCWRSSSRCWPPPAGD